MRKIHSGVDTLLQPTLDAIPGQVIVTSPQSGGRGAEWADLSKLGPVFLSYILSFVYIGIYWNIITC